MGKTIVRLSAKGQVSALLDDRGQADVMAAVMGKPAQVAYAAPEFRPGCTIMVG
ncbi:hypothetical protein OG738_21410 [Amycolatopsis sp. NBC_01488]|uniref:hypothetical protein n=1 Tax=Amycolatopsis sp. NBC_01488 TaxID=2903563 RepID=UPI002E295527|nr:hypothetical protein [Amycolatopsis sp. NBC_01488]